MRLKFTPAQLKTQPEVMDILFSKMLAKVDWNAEDLNMGQIQYCLDNDIVLDKAELYSPVLTGAQLDAEVPLSWPGGHTLDEEGEVIYRKSFKEYLRGIEVEGGTVLQYAGGCMDSNRNIKLPTNSQLRAQITVAGGFLTIAEVNAIRIV